MNKKDVRAVCLQAIALTLLVSAFACDLASRKRQPLTIGLNIWPGYGAFFIAQDRGLYAAEGVDVNIEIIQGDAEREQAFVAGRIDGIGMTMDNLVRLRGKGVNAKAIFKYDDSYGADGIVTTNKVQSPSDLRGIRVAYALGTTSHFFLAEVLRDAKMTTKDIQTVSMSSDDAGAAFVAGKIDAAVTWEPWLSKAKERPNGKLLISTRDKPVIEDVLFMNGRVLDERPDDVRRFLRACFKAVDYWKAHRDEGNRIIAKKLGLPLADLEGMLGGIRIMDLQMNREFFGTMAQHGPAYKAYLDAVDAWVQEGVIAGRQTPEDGIDQSFVNSIQQ